MISDNVLAYDMVTMTGDIVHVTKASNAELFSALQVGKCLFHLYLLLTRSVRSLVRSSEL